ncbi:hypothetical protein HQ403_01950 [Candidatus Kaiserbacteria bacterium]|nr:hypothetical protein [Candidatus Kaiserbacteria bacterium]
MINAQEIAGSIAQVLRVAPSYTYAQGVMDGIYEPLTVEYREPSKAIEKNLRITHTIKQ